jgi:hypothetical protein
MLRVGHWQPEEVVTDSDHAHERCRPPGAFWHQESAAVRVKKRPKRYETRCTQDLFKVFATNKFPNSRKIKTKSLRPLWFVVRFTV